MAGTVVVSAAVEAVVGVVVGGVTAYLVGKHKDKASKRHNVERLEIAHTELELALERSKNLPITDVSLLRKRKIIVRGYEECGHVLHKYKQLALEDEENEQAVTRPSFPKRMARTTRSSISSLGCFDVGRFERLADVAREFRIELESGCSLRQYMFIRPLVKPLLEGKTLWYKMVQGGRSHIFGIVPACLEGRGAEAVLRFTSRDLKMPTKGSFDFWLALRLSENTDMVGIAIECLRSLGLPFKSLAQLAMGEVAQLPARDVIVVPTTSALELFGFIPLQWENRIRNWRPDPLCCGANAHIGPRANNSISSSEISHRFPEQVILMGFICYIPTFDEHNLQISSPDEVVRDAIASNWAPLELLAAFAPHASREDQGDSYAYEEISGQEVPINGSLHELEEMVLAKAVDYFIQQPESTEYCMPWYSAHAHGRAGFCVRKPITESKGRSKTRRVAKRRK